MRTRQEKNNKTSVWSKIVCADARHDSSLADIPLDVSLFEPVMYHAIYCGPTAYESIECDRLIVSTSSMQCSRRVVHSPTLQYYTRHAINIEYNIIGCEISDPRLRKRGAFSDRRSEHILSSARACSVDPWWATKPLRDCAYLVHLSGMNSLVIG